MFNPFKKKKEGNFSLDDSTLPRLNETPSLNLDNENSNQPPEQNENNKTPFEKNLSPNNSFTALANTTPTFSENNLSLKNDLLKTKLETIETKMNLVESRMDGIDSKINMIYRMLYEEISDSTKQKLNLENIKDDLHKRIN